MTIEIVLLAMIALFVGLRLYSVLGQRTGHEQQPVTRPEATAEQPAVATAPEIASNPAEPSGYAYEKGASAGIRSIIAADPAFDVARFGPGHRLLLVAGALAEDRVEPEPHEQGDHGKQDDLDGQPNSPGSCSPYIGPIRFRFK